MTDLILKSPQVQAGRAATEYAKEESATLIEEGA